MPLTSFTLPIPEGVEAVSAGDVDGDGRDELIFESHRKADGKPDAVTLTVIPFATTGAAGTARSFALDSRASLWDADHGLWLVDRDGLARLDTGGTRVAKLSTLLGALGPTTPARADLAWDLDADHVPELIVWSQGQYRVFRADGTDLGAVAAPARGELDPGYAQGGSLVTATLRPPPLSVGDWDGDGRLDLLVPQGKKLSVAITGDTVGVRTSTMALPVDLDPPHDRPLAEGEVRREVGGVWLMDLDGDNKVDLGVQRTILNGSWFGATTEFLFAKGTGSGLAALQTLSIQQAAFALRPVDADGDGRQELMAALVDVGVGNIARAIVSKEVVAQLSLFRSGASGYGATPVPIHTLRFPLEHPEKLHVDLSADVDGDKHLDLVTDDATSRLMVFRGGPSGFANTPALTADITVPVGDESLFVHDLTGDGRAEIVVWGRGSRTATVLRAQ